MLPSSEEYFEPTSSIYLDYFFCSSQFLRQADQIAIWFLKPT